MPIYFDNKGFECIYINFILNENDIINCFPESLREDEIQSIVYGFSNTIRN